MSVLRKPKRASRTMPTALDNGQRSLSTEAAHGWARRSTLAHEAGGYVLDRVGRVVGTLLRCRECGAESDYLATGWRACGARVRSLRLGLSGN
jgi:hypothetical protein